MGSRVKRSRRPLTDEELHSSLQKEISKEADEMLENISLKDVPLEERRKEAQKSLYLTRYE
jgi:hypothetical protein